MGVDAVIETPRVPKQTFLLKPGSLDRSTSLWWLIPLAVVWIATAALLIFLSLDDAGALTLRSTLWTILFIAVFTTLWGGAVVFTQRESDTETGPESIDVRARHRYWRARTIAWDVTAIGVSGVGLVTLLLIGPDRILPTPYVPLVELGVLVLTLALLATFSRYAAMAFSTDSKGVVQKLELISSAEAVARSQDREQLKETFHDEIERLVSKVSEQITATQSGLSQVAVALQSVANAVELQARVGEEARHAAEEAARATEQRLVDLRTSEVQRQEASRVTALERRRRISPSIEVAVEIGGTVFHSVWIKVRNTGFDGRGLELGVDYGVGGPSRFVAAGLSSMEEIGFSLGDVGGLPLSTVVRIEGSIADLDGERRAFRAPPILYARETGILGTTRRIGVRPAGWVRAIEIPRVALTAPSSAAE